MQTHDRFLVAVTGMCAVIVLVALLTWGGF